MEKINDLLGYKDRKIYQNDEYFSFNMDTVMLANFVKGNLKNKKIIDIGTGTGAIPLIISKRTDSKIDALEIQEEYLKLFKKSIDYNLLNDQINLINADINEFYKTKNNYYDIIICNPPYYNSKSNNKIKTISRHTKKLDIFKVIKISKCMLKNNGKLYIVHDAKDFQIIINSMIENNLMPKRVRFVHDSLHKSASIVLIECVKNGKSNIEIEAPIILKNEDGSNTKMYSNILNGGFLYESKEL